MNSKRLDKYHEAIDYLYAHNKNLYIEVTKLGYPKFSNSLAIPTAGVAWDEQKKRIIFLFDAGFFDRLNIEQLAFIIGHEASHVFNLHMFQAKRMHDKYKARGRKIEIPYMMKKLNVAQDCVINDSLVFWFKFPKILSTEKEIRHVFGDEIYEGIKKAGKKSGLMYGKEVINMDCHDLTSEEVFELMEDPPEYKMMKHAWESFFNEDGTLKEEFVKKIKDFIERNKSSSGLTEEELYQMEKMEDEYNKTTDPSVAGNEINKNKRSISTGNSSLNWDRILANFVEIRKMEDVWNRPNRKLYDYYPDVLLPYWKDREIQEVFVAIDSSGSIDYNALSLFATLIKNTPDHIKIKAISFDTQCYEYDPKGDKDPIGGGGTKFDIIEQYIQNNFKKYPKAVFVLTDGAGCPVQPKHKERWCWLLYGPCMEDYCKDMKKYKIYDIIRK